MNVIQRIKDWYYAYSVYREYKLKYNPLVEFGECIKRIEK